MKLVKLTRSAVSRGDLAARFPAGVRFRQPVYTGLDVVVQSLDARRTRLVFPADAVEPVADPFADWQDTGEPVGVAP